MPTVCRSPVIGSIRQIWFNSGLSQAVAQRTSRPEQMATRS